MNQRQSITTAFEKQTTLQEKEYRVRLNASIDCVRFLSCQGLVFRGHDKTDNSDNKGNFLELLQCDIQKDIMHACSDATINVIMEVIGKDFFFAILVDESRDVSCKEQLTLVLRFVNKKGEVVERFVGLRHISDTSALTPKETIYDMLSKWDLSELESGTSLNQEVGSKRLSDTRWGSHFSSLLNIKNIYSSICEVVEHLGRDNSHHDRKAEAIRILRLLKSFDFVFCLHLMVDILGITNHLNTTLKRKDQDIVNAMNHIWKMNIMMDSVVEEVHRLVNNLHHYHIDVFKALIDMQLQELNHRFNEANTKLLLCITCLCHRESFKAFELDKLMEMDTLYREDFRTKYDLQLLDVELKNYIKNVREDERFNQLKNIGELSKKMVEVQKHIIYSKVYLLLKLALILPIATASVERAFSTMKLVKNVCNNMGD
ncbi:uncharacterized protein LOC111915579 [Lactuca sativa]|uniref:uncharacterized protein LOC111915579 n=1 Tax=Lactuca sativa TaxID=4236 RepID=UPI0022AF3F23|nr:uncharacterized protein LOC111915579 [Lactuca sativa]